MVDSVLLFWVVLKKPLLSLYVHCSFRAWRWHSLPLVRQRTRALRVCGAFKCLMSQSRHSPLSWEPSERKEQPGCRGLGEAGEEAAEKFSQIVWIWHEATIILCVGALCLTWWDWVVPRPVLASSARSITRRGEEERVRRAGWMPLSARRWTRSVWAAEPESVPVSPSVQAGVSEPDSATAQLRNRQTR